MRTRIITIGVLAVMMSSCASIIHGTTQMIEFTSQPSGARITIDGKERGRTPQLIELRRKGREKGEPKKKHYQVKILLDGYYPYEVKIRRYLSAWFFVNDIIGMVIDASNGAMYKLSPEQVVARLNKNSTGMIDTIDDKIYVEVAMKIDPKWEKIGQLNRIE